MSIFSAAVILLLNCWSNPTAKSESNDVKRIVQCVNTLQTFEQQWPFAGRFWYVMTALVTCNLTVGAASDAISHLVSGVYPKQRQPAPWAELMGMPFPSSNWVSSSDDAYAQNFWVITEDVFHDTLPLDH
ncbi:uncharacterized protein ARMOST_04785 [Armillaria ostoyae]|uniref:Uncharacterized protein n=1 Tax=Armillaria ostoyae TaxID=47428 RepID=A0A284QYB6_ARMOS|nr:uncharacterized protein ARMOST_04785 [Armillaria ostoyae]